MLNVIQQKVGFAAGLGLGAAGGSSYQKRKRRRRM